MLDADGVAERIVQRHQDAAIGVIGESVGAAIRHGPRALHL